VFAVAVITHQAAKTNLPLKYNEDVLLKIIKVQKFNTQSNLVLLNIIIMISLEAVSLGMT
jgi:hypothetical protein